MLKPRLRVTHTKANEESVMTPEDRQWLEAARARRAGQYSGINGIGGQALQDLRRYDALVVELEVRNESLQKFSRDMEETIDNVRESLGLESTHYLVIADQVVDVVKERDALRTAALNEKQC